MTDVDTMIDGFECGLVIDADGWARTTFRIPPQARGKALPRPEEQEAVPTTLFGRPWKSPTEKDRP